MYIFKYIQNNRMNVEVHQLPGLAGQEACNLHRETFMGQQLRLSPEILHCDDI